MQFQEKLFIQKLKENALMTRGLVPILNDTIIEDAFWDVCPELDSDSLYTRYVFHTAFLPKIKPMLRNEFYLM